MQSLKDIADKGYPAAGRLFLLLGMLMLGACAIQPQKNFHPPPLLHPGPEIQVADVDVLAVSPAMEEFLGRYVLPYPISLTRIQLLASSVSGIGVLGFDYDETLTLTATEAFDARAGNCIGFANMMIALARRAGLKANYQEVIRHPVWSMDEKTMLLIKHVNVVIEGKHFDYVMDVSGIKIHQNEQRRIVGDSYAKALYMNNLGAEALLVNDLPTAYAYITMAIETEPMLVDSWVNLGVVFGRNDQLDDAKTVLETALDINGSQFSAMSNLYEVYLEQGDFEAAQNLQVKVEKYRLNNPYYLLHLSDQALELNQLDESMNLLHRAIKKKEDDHMLHFALAKTQYLSGEKTAAQNSLKRARELAPQEMLAYYARPLNELIAEEKAERSLLTR
jgi:tetratricopeptide (TPR) repeat protein